MVWRFEQFSSSGNRISPACICSAEDATPQPEPAEAEDPRPGHSRPSQAPRGNSRHPASRARRAGGSPCRLPRPENVTGRDRPATNRPRCAEGRVVQGRDSRAMRQDQQPAAPLPLREPKAVRRRPLCKGVAHRGSAGSGTGQILGPGVRGSALPGRRGESGNPVLRRGRTGPTCRPGRAGKGPETAAVRFRPGAQPSE